MAPPAIEEHAVAVTVFGRTPREGVARVRVWSAGERAVRVLKGLGACWGLAIVTAFIPVAHFFLVPGFAIGGVVLAVRWSGQSRTYVEARGPCPACGEEGVFGVKGKFTLPRETECAACGARVALVSPA
jgi:hypothetical protein